MEAVLIHPLSGLLSAYGMGLAASSPSRQQALLQAARRGIRWPTSMRLARDAARRRAGGTRRARHRREATSSWRPVLHIRYDGTDTALPVDFEQRLARRARGRRSRRCTRRSSASSTTTSRWSSRRSRSKAATAGERGRDEADSALQEIDATPSDDSRNLRRRRLARAGVFRREALRPGHSVARPGADHRAIRRSSSSRAGRRRSPPRTTSCCAASRRSAARPRSAPRPTRSCSRSSTTSSCRSPSRWA